MHLARINKSNNYNNMDILADAECNSDSGRFNAGRQSNFKDSIFITGYIEDNTLVNAYREAIAFIYPSFHEGFGLPVLEAMSCGTPVITSNNSSLPEIGKDSVLYCDPSSLEDISSAMERVSTDSLLGEKLSNMGLRRAEYFSWKKTAQKTAQVISSLLN